MERESETGYEGPPARRGSGAWWLIIGVATVLIAWGHAVLGEREAAVDDRATLVILRMQTKVLIGAEQLAPGTTAAEAEQLEAYAVTPRLASAIAAYRAFAGPGTSTGRERALELIAPYRDADDLSPSEARLVEDVAEALEHPEALPEPSRQRLRAELGWFGRLLLAYDEGSDAAERQAIESSALEAFVFLVGLVIVAFLGTIAGIVLLSVAVYNLAHDKLRMRYAPPETDERPYVQAFAIYIALFFLLLVAPTLAGIDIGGFAYLGLVAASVIGVIWPRVVGEPIDARRRVTGLHGGRGFLSEAGAGIVGYVAILPIVAGGFLTSMLLIVLSGYLFPAAPDEAPELVSHPVVLMMAEGDWIVRVLVLLLAAGFAPFFEEIMFRGALLSGLRKRMGRYTAGVVMAVVFAAVHPQGLLLIPALGALAFGFGLIREWRDSLIAPMVGHALHNGVLVGFMWVVFG